MEEQIARIDPVFERRAESCFFDIVTSELLTARLLKDDMNGIIELVQAAQGPADVSLEDRLSWKLTHSVSSHASASASACRLPHLCIVLACRRVLRYLVENYPRLLLLTDAGTDVTTGTNLLHFMAEASCTSSTSYRAFQIEAFQMLRFTELQNMAEEDKECNSPKASLLKQLRLMENAQGLRPLEFSMLIGAYSTVQLILDVENYLLVKQTSHGIRVRSAYDFQDYDLLDGQRRDRHPLLMLTLMQSGQSDDYVKSGLQDLPIMKKWIKSINKYMNYTLAMRLTSLSALTSSFTPFSLQFDVMVSMGAIGYQLETGFERYTNLLKLTLISSDGSSNSENATSSSYNITDMEATVKSYCSFESFVYYLTDSSYPNNTHMLYQSPLWSANIINRTKIVENWMTLPFMLSTILVIQFIVLAFNLVKEVQFTRRCKRWIPNRHSDEYVVRSQFFLVTYALSFGLGVMFMAASKMLQQSLDCTDYVLDRRGPRNWRLSLAANVSECAAVLYIFFTLFSVIESNEWLSRGTSFLFISFRRSIGRFINALPLFILWTYIVFGNLLYMTDFRGSEFKTPHSVFYSSLRLLLNMANISQGLPSAILHTLFVLVVGINVQNFLIAIISNSFRESVSKFETIYTLNVLNCSFQTWRLYSWLTRLFRCVCGCKKSAKNRDERLVRVWTLKPPHPNYMGSRMIERRIEKL